MVARRTDAPRAPIDRILGNADGLETQRREAANGTPALRNNADQRLLLDGNSQVPLVVPTTSDGANLGVALKFNPSATYGGALEARTPEDDRMADLNARYMGTDYVEVGAGNSKLYTDGSADFGPGGKAQIAANGQIYTQFEVRADQGIRAEQGLSCGLDMAVGQKCISTYNWGMQSGMFDGSITWASNGALAIMNQGQTGYVGCYSTNFQTVLPSWRRLKRDLTAAEEYLGRPALDVVRGLDIRAWRYDPAKVTEFDTEEVHLGPMLDEVPEQLHADPPASVFQGAEGPAPGPNPDLGTYDRDKMLSVALAAIQDLSAQVDALAAQNADLTSRVRELEEPAAA